MTRSRLSTNKQEKAKKNLLLALLGIIILFLLVLFFGGPLLINLSLIFEKSRDTNTASKKDASYLSPPVLDPLFSATNSATVTIHGTGDEKTSVILFVNDEETDEVEINDDRDFSFEEVKLKKGENEIKVKAKDRDDNESNFSEPLTISFITEPPSLDITSPGDGKQYEKEFNTAQVTGTTDSKTRVTVNGFWAVMNADGKFQYNLPLKEGENVIKVTATDTAGNKTENEIKVRYAP
ncbi:MAG: hypothetical protein HY430_04275 [Candidatus Levybacteria bacterium]|nr:hypothetical protein [Candidatus Levybacteria bacterium]